MRVLLLCSTQSARVSLSAALAYVLATLPGEVVEYSAAHARSWRGRGLTLAMAFAPALRALRVCGAVLRARANPQNNVGTAVGARPAAGTVGGATLLCGCGLEVCSEVCHGLFAHRVSPLHLLTTALATSQPQEIGGPVCPWKRRFNEQVLPG